MGAVGVLAWIAFLLVFWSAVVISGPVSLPFVLTYLACGVSGIYAMLSRKRRARRAAGSR